MQSFTREKYRPHIRHTPYLIHPILGGNHLGEPEITEGFLYSPAETRIHGARLHRGIDYRCEKGTKVLAAAAGLAVGFYNRRPLRSPDGTFRLLDGKPLGNGFGYAIQISHPPEVTGTKGWRITQYGHLSQVHPELLVRVTDPIEFNIPEYLTGINARKLKYGLSPEQLKAQIEEQMEIVKRYPWTSRIYGLRVSGNDYRKLDSYVWNPAELEEQVNEGSPFVRWVEQGEVIGVVGKSALIHGDLTYKEGMAIPDTGDSEEGTWDERHLHFEVGGRNSKRVKRWQDCPYDVYLSAIHYQNNVLPKNAGKQLFIDF